MSLMNWGLWLLAAALLATLLLRDWRRDRRVVVVLLALAALGLLLAWLDTARVETMGGGDGASWADIGLLALAMFAGMAAQYFYFRDDAQSFRWQPFLRPLLASPLVFLPVAAELAKTELKFAAGPDPATFLSLLVAFQNGFFWKVVFDRSARQAEEGE